MKNKSPQSYIGTVATVLKHPTWPYPEYKPGLIMGFDYWNTATQDPVAFAALAYAIRHQGGKVYIITAVGKKRASKNVAEVEALNIPNDGIHQVIFDKPQEAPQLKADKAVELGIQWFIDDRRDICQAMFDRGIIACNIVKPWLKKT